MITNERQFRITKKWLERFEQASAGVAAPGVALQPRARQAWHDQYESQIEELRAEVADYEALRKGPVTLLSLNSLSELPEALIRVRAAAGLSQAALAERLGLKKQQVQRYEATRYAGVSLDRVQAVADALGVKVREPVVLAVSADAPRDTIAGPARRPTSLVGRLTRAGLSQADLAERLGVPLSVTISLQRGLIDPATVPERLFDKLGQELGIDAEEVRRLIVLRKDRGASGTDSGAPPQEKAGQSAMSFRDALTNAPDLNDAHRSAWLSGPATK